jgi:outer membrane protein OmpA-like peptidoglycan-associated protein
VPPPNRGPGVLPAPQGGPGQPQTAPGQTQLAPPPGQPPAAGQPPAPDQRQGRRGLGLGGAAALGLGAGVIGGIMATQGAERLDQIRGRREERRDGDVTIIREPGRTIIREDDGTAIIRRDETQRFRDLGYDGRSERQGGETRTVFDRPDGTRVVTITDEEGRLIRRTRLDRDGREVVIIDNTLRDRPGRFADEVVVLERPPLPLPRERYIVDAERADRELIYETIIAPPIAPIPRRYTLDEVRYSPDLRARMRSVDIDTVNFASGSWQVTPDQAQRLAVIADTVRRALQASPNEVFLVEGHTDAVGNDIDNLSLSDRRAQSVAEILTRDFGVPAENLTTQGYGEQYLKVQTQGESRENRRVTLRRITPLLTGESR